MSEELKPCPVCGHRKILQNSGDGYFVSCMKCGSRGSKKKYYETMSDAITAWNTRPIEDEKDKEIERLKEVIADIGTIICTGPVNLDVIFQKCKEAIGEPLLTEAYLKEIRKRAGKIGKDTNVLANPTDNNVGGHNRN